VWQLQIAADIDKICQQRFVGILGNKRPNADLYNYKLNTHVLATFDVVRDLGVHVDCFLKF